MDKLAAGGIRYSNFHVIPMCSPTRAALLAGRNPHAVGVGIVAEWANGMPGYDGRVHPSAGILPQVLKENSYNTLAVGKWHLTATEEYGAAGPFSNWPLSKGFNRWYGFHGALTDQFHPELRVDNHLVRTAGQSSVMAGRLEGRVPAPQRRGPGDGRVGAVPP